MGIKGKQLNLDAWDFEGIKREIWKRTPEGKAELARLTEEEEKRVA